MPQLFLSYPFLTIFSYSCSLACTQSHKIYCAPKPLPLNQESTEASVDSNASPSIENGDNVNALTGDIDRSLKQSTVDSTAASSEVKDLLERYPQLRAQLHEIYLATQEDQWVEWYTPSIRGRPRGRGGKTLSRRSRGPWTAEKGFNRGLGRVRKLRQGWEDGTERGPTPEAFMQFLALVNGNNQEGVPKGLH